MSIAVITSPSLDELSKKIMTDLKEELNHNTLGVFDKQWIVTQTEGINFWMKNQIAEHTGIAANLQFAKMNDIVQLIYHWICPNTARLIDKDRMTWTLFAELDEQEFKDAYQNIAGYYADSQMRRVSLAVEMADLFDQYQIYRHKVIEAWNADTVEDDADLTWQQYLWKKMKARLGDGFADRLEVSKKLLSELYNPDNQNLIKIKIPCLRFFGIAIVTPYFLEIFKALSKFIDVHFYLLNPCPDIIWMYDDTEKSIAIKSAKKINLEVEFIGNELLLNWGSVMKDSYKLMLGDEFYINRYYSLNEGLVKDVPKNLLKSIQFEIHNNTPNEQRDSISSEFINDGSIKINGCFTPIREVEVLYNYLLDQFASDKSLRAREVVVMVNDMDKYAPFIRAVFDNAPVQIPYSIADESVTKGNTIFSAIQEILSINADMYKSEEVLGLLDSSYIRNRFGFKDIAGVRQAVREAGIANGMGSENTSDMNYEATQAWMVSWEYGLQKIMYGLCISSDVEYAGGTRPLYPLDTAEGAGMNDRIRLYEFINRLKEILRKRSEEKTLGEWSDYLGDIMNEMILGEDEEDDDIPRLAKLKEVISELEDMTGKVKIDFPTFRQVFFSRLEQEKRSNRYADRGINFCGMLPMRSVPYKIVAMLGLNFDTFPRQDSALSFSLIGKQKRLGDRSVRENDKHLFLESILAAKEKLYLSYLARDVKKGGEQPPSTLVDELMDYIVLMTDKPSENKKSMICVHPLHVFSSKYANDENKLPSNYVGNSLVQGIEFEKDPTRIIDSPDFSEIKLHDFATFFKHPIKYYFNKNLGVYYREDDERIPENELFELDGLQAYIIKDKLIEEGEDLILFTEKMKHAGKLPLANVGKVLIKNLQADVSEFKEKVKNILNGSQQTALDVEYEHGDSKINGRLTVYGTHYVYYAFSTSVFKHLMYPWISYLVAIAQESSPVLNFNFVFRFKVNNKVSIENLFVPFSTEMRDYAREILPTLLQYFKNGNEDVFLFYAPLAPLCYKNNPAAFKADDLQEKYEDEPDESYGNGYFDDDYVIKVVETPTEHFNIFYPQQMDTLTRHTKMLMDKLNELFPKIFKP